MASPNDIPRLAITLSVRNGIKALDFYKAAFGAQELFQISDESGSIVAQLAFAGRDFWLAEESPENLNFSPESLAGRTSARMMLVVDEPDALFDRAIAAGATVIRTVTDEPYGWRVGRLVDPFGHHWEIAKPLG